MSFIPDLTEEVQKVIWSCKLKKPTHLPSKFNCSINSQVDFQKYLGSTRDSKFNFEEYLKTCTKELRKRWQLCTNFKMFYLAFITYYIESFCLSLNWLWRYYFSFLGEEVTGRIFSREQKVLKKRSLRNNFNTEN